MMSSNVTLLNVHATPITLQMALPRSMSQPLIAPVSGSTYSFGAYVASVAIWNGASAFMSAGTSDAMLDTVPGPLGVGVLDAVVPPPQAVSRTSPEIARTCFLN